MQNNAPELAVSIPEAFTGLCYPSRYKVYYGGRGGAKSWAFAMMLLAIGGKRPIRVLCARELQKSISDSVHKLLSDIIKTQGLERFYTVQNASIKGVNGTEFIFKGLKHNPTEIKSTEGVDICWVEEAERVSENSWEVLIPTIRKANSEIWVSFNCKQPTDPTFVRFVMNTPPNTVLRKVSWRDNPYFPAVLDIERRHLEATDPEAYKHIWEGEFDTRYFGGVYAKWVADCKTAGRITNVAVEPNAPVNTAWDLGYDDSTAVWFWQYVAGEIRLIDFFEDSNKDIEHYCEMIRLRGYKYGKHFVPHDAANKTLQAGGRSIAEQMAARLGGLGNIRVVAATSQQNGIEAARKTLQYAWFDETKCADGIQALMNYQFLYDDDRKTYKNTPNHDWSSHAADAFEIIGQVWKTPIIDPTPAAPRFLHQITADELFWGSS